MGTYKDSGIEWIGEIPEEWNTDIAKNIFKEHKLRNDKNLENNLLSLSYGKIVQKDIESLAGLIPESFSTYNIIQKDDIVLRLTDLQNDKRSLRTALCKEDRGIITSAYLTLRLNTNNNASYLHYLLHSYDVCKVFYNLGGGVRLGGSWSDVGKLHLLLPPLQEQAAIAGFLDKKNTEIDAIIAKITQQIQTLKDYRHSLITQTVTKGLDKTIAYKDSGIEWIGEIPEGWGKSDVKYLFEIISGATPESNNSEYWDGPINWITPADMNPTGPIKNGEKTITMLGYQSCGTTMIPENSIIISNRAPIGKINYNQTELCTSQGCKGLVNIKKNNLLYFYYFFIAFSNQLKLLGRGTTFLELSTKDLGNFSLIVPPLQEQAAIADFLDDKTAKINRIIAKKKQQLDIIKEYRKSLIYEYVTGKKRVKEYQQDGNQSKSIT